MAAHEIISDIEKLQAEASAAIEAATDEKEVEELRVKYLGKKGPIQGFMKSLGQLGGEERKDVGAAVNEAKRVVGEKLDAKKEAVANAYFDNLAKTEWMDVTAPGPRRLKGTLHPISLIQRELETIFTGMGFVILDGPETENDWYNFEALNIPKDHPARDMQDTFWTEDGNLLRTHTSTMQIRGMKDLKPPFRVIAPGRVFRYEATDASHENTFYQMEGMMIGEDISVANLIYVMRTLLSQVFKADVTVRLRPGYFPFVEPGFELDMLCLICGGKGCPVCKQSGWVEVLPCGLVHPNVLSLSGIDPDKWQGFAFGLGLMRLVMLRLGVNDIRRFMSGDLRFLRQFDGV